MEAAEFVASSPNCMRRRIASLSFCIMKALHEGRAVNAALVPGTRQSSSQSSNCHVFLFALLEDADPGQCVLMHVDLVLQLVAVHVH